MSRVRSGALTTLSGDRFILVAEPVAARIAEFLKRDERRLEAGGVLLGLRRDPHIEIVEATLPSASDVRRPYRFVRGCDSHQAAATRAWQDSRQFIDYVGEWHTHPEDWPTPSGIDRRELLRRAEEHRDALIELIIGQRTTFAAIVANGHYGQLKWLNARSV